MTNDKNNKTGIKSKCCNSTITVGAFASRCDRCGNSVNPGTGEQFIDSDTGKPHEPLDTDMVLW